MVVVTPVHPVVAGQELQHIVFFQVVVFAELKPGDALFAETDDRVTGLTY